MKGSKNPRVRQDVSQECKTVEAKQLQLRREDFQFQREAVSLMGDKRLSKWKKC
ncbi:hypothetical protein MtrunA17_Chr6g0469291 [Medicago truncatula]|uniref:Uncharacterized protein n=1 Tax=Medicago truncatula TaxID=3880 RepID=A0A396HDU5_MEDTR|nr:hypothetical protein MtrunA17_Chr6g0469291 [Medicago truncatula]